MNFKDFTEQVPLNCVCGFDKWHFPHYDKERRWMRCVSCKRRNIAEDQNDKPEYKWVRVKVDSLT